MGHERIVTIAFGLALAGVLVHAGARLASPATPALIGAGLMLCAGAPLLFLLRKKKPAARQHPVLISALCGLGCVMIMIGVQRFGDQHQPMLVLALLVLVGWMAYQRRVWRANDTTDR